MVIVVVELPVHALTRQRGFWPLCILRTVDCDGGHSDSDDSALNIPQFADPIWSTGSVAQSVFYPDAVQELLFHSSDR